jgi:hypothetical protein
MIPRVIDRSSKAERIGAKYSCKPSKSASAPSGPWKRNPGEK